MERGYIKLYRSIIDNWVWQKKPFTPGQAWAHMIMTANHKEGTIWVQGTPVKVGRGQIGKSKETLASDFGWTRSITRTFIKHLISDHMISHESVGKLSLITITNYDKYHGSDQAVDQALAIPSPNDDHSIATNNKNKNNKNKKKKNISPNMFEDFWQAYPRRNGQRAGKKATLRRFKLLGEDDVTLLMQATKHYAESQTAQNNFAKDPERFLKDDYWRDWIEGGESAGDKPGSSKVWDKYREDK